MIKQYRINEVKKSQHLATTSRVYAAIVIVYSIEVLQPVVYRMLTKIAETVVFQGSGKVHKAFALKGEP